MGLLCRDGPMVLLVLWYLYFSVKMVFCCFSVLHLFIVAFTSKLKHLLLTGELIWLDSGGNGFCEALESRLCVSVVKWVRMSCRFLLISPAAPSQDEDFVTRDDFEDVDQLRIGNDGIFMLTFFSEFPNPRASFLFLWCIALKHRLLFPVAFLFNWIGFFLSFCLTTSAAGRYGAISGFGLSLIKWVLIVRVYTYFIYVFIFKD